MSSELRQRSVASSQPTMNRVGSDAPIVTNYDEAHLSARALLSASPIHAGPVMKVHVPVLYTFLPTTVQWIISRCCPKSWSPQWKRRYLIAIGGYLYRFKDEDGASPKGTPISVTMIDARIISNDNVGELNISSFDILPDGCNTLFEVSSIGKTQYFAVDSKEEAAIWVNSLKQMKQEAISRSMGHSDAIPYPKEWTSFDASAKRLGDQKKRIKSKLEAMNKKEQEMQSLGGGSGGMSMGYYS